MAFTLFNKGYSSIEQSPLKLNYTGKIRDSIHDTISFTEEEKIIINTYEFQRLRRISQTAFTCYAFPGATHTRFEHSLGVMQIAHNMLNAIISNQRRLLKEFELTKEFVPSHIFNSLVDSEKLNGSLSLTKQALNILESSPYITQCLRFAALLHDIGHAPFSHSSEKFMISWEKFEENIDSLETSNWLKTAFNKKLILLKKKYANLSEIKIRHEVYTLLIISKIFRYDNEFLSEKMGQDICSIIDLSISPNTNSELYKSGLQNLLHEIISGEIDSDRMDYLLRDSRECGIIYGYFDIGRLFDSLGFYLNIQTQKYHLALKRSGISAFEDYLRARLSMYQQVYCHKTVTACEAMLQHIGKQLPDFCLPIDLDEYIKIDEHNFYTYFDEKYSNESNNFPKVILYDLIYKRKLWKRVYEECIPKNLINVIPSLCPAIQNFLQDLECPSEIIENNTNLTIYSAKGREITSKNNLKIIIKDVHSLKYLEPIENHSTLINKMDEEIIIKRIYVSRYKINNDEIFSQDIQKKISEKIINPEKNI